MKLLKVSLALVFTMLLVVSCRKDEEIAVCIDESKINPNAVCTTDYTPVCGCDGKTYSNACHAENAGVLNYQPGECQ